MVLCHMKKLLGYVLHRYVDRILKPGEFVTRCGCVRLTNRCKKYMVYMTNLRIIIIKKISLLHCNLEAYPRNLAKYTVGPGNAQR